MNNTTEKRVSKGRPPLSQGENRREHILDNALVLFAEQGISGTTVAQIAQASGVTSAMVHYYFHNREGLLDCLVAERLAPLIQYIWADITENHLTDPRQLVTSIINHLLKAVEDSPHLPQLWNREIFHAGGCLRKRFMQYIPLDCFEKVRTSLKEAQQKGLLNPQIVPELVIVSAISLIMLPLAAQDMLSGALGLPTLKKKDLGRHALTLMLDGLCPKKEGQQ